MRYSKGAAAAAMVAGLALVFAGCFGFNGIKFSKTSLKPGNAKKSVSKVAVDVIPRGGDRDNAKFFLLVGLPNGATDGDTSDDALRVRAAKFTKGPFTNRNKRLRSNAALRNEILAEGDCGRESVESTNFAYRAFLSDQRISSAGRRSKRGVVKFSLKQIRNSGDIQPANLDVRTGFWDDDGDGIPEAGGLDPEVNCTGGAHANLRLKVGSNPRQVSRADLRAAAGE